MPKCQRKTVPSDVIGQVAAAAGEIRFNDCPTRVYRPLPSSRALATVSALSSAVLAVEGGRLLSAGFHGPASLSIASLKPTLSSAITRSMAPRPLPPHPRQLKHCLRVLMLKSVCTAADRTGTNALDAPAQLDSALLNHAFDRRLSRVLDEMGHRAIPRVLAPVLLQWNCRIHFCASLAKKRAIGLTDGLGFARFRVLSRNLQKPRAPPPPRAGFVFIRRGRRALELRLSSCGARRQAQAVSLA